jgi:hypothetical protein
MPNVTNAEGHISSLYAEFHYAECHYAECHYAECRGAFLDLGAHVLLLLSEKCSYWPLNQFIFGELQKISSWRDTHEFRTNYAETNFIVKIFSLEQMLLKHRLNVVMAVTNGANVFSITTRRIMTFSISINKSRHSAQWHSPLSIVMLSLIYAECH